MNATELFDYIQNNKFNTKEIENTLKKQSCVLGDHFDGIFKCKDLLLIKVKLKTDSSNKEYYDVWKFNFGSWIK